MNNAKRFFGFVAIITICSLIPQAYAAKKCDKLERDTSAKENQYPSHWCCTTEKGYRAKEALNKPTSDEDAYGKGESHARKFIKLTINTANTLGTPQDIKRLCDCYKAGYLSMRRTVYPYYLPYVEGFLNVFKNSLPEAREKIVDKFNVSVFLVFFYLTYINALDEYTRYEGKDRAICQDRDKIRKRFTLEKPFTAESFLAPIVQEACGFRSEADLERLNELLRKFGKYLMD